MNRVSYSEQQKCHNLTNYCQKAKTKKSWCDGETKMSETIGWDEALPASKYVKLEDDKRTVLVVQTPPKFEKVEKTFSNETKTMVQLSLDVLEQDGEVFEEPKQLDTVSKRFIAGLRKFLEAIPDGSKVKLSVKRITSANKTDTTYDVELVEVMK